jgi:FlaA1/EpsC-like NDP-sugar epimerase
VLALIWLSLLALVDSRSRRIRGYRAEEYRRIIDATLVLFGVIAFPSVVLELDLAGGHLAIALPLGLIGLLVNRRIWRGVAARKRAKGEYQTSLLVVGSSSAAAEVAAKLVRARELGFYVVGLCTPEGPTSQAEAVLIASRDVPVVGVDTAVIDTVKRTWCRHSCHVTYRPFDAGGDQAADLGPRSTRRRPDRHRRSDRRRRRAHQQPTGGGRTWSSSAAPFWSCCAAARCTNPALPP